MYSLPARNKEILVRNIRRYKEQCFPGKGSGRRLAGEIGVHPQTVTQWLNGSRTPTVKQLYRLSIAFNVSPLNLCGIQDKGEPSESSSAVSMLREVLNVLENDRKNHVKSCATRKIMKEFNVIVSNGIKEMKRRRSHKKT